MCLARRRSKFLEVNVNGSEWMAANPEAKVALVESRRFSAVFPPYDRTTPK